MAPNVRGSMGLVLTRLMALLPFLLVQNTTAVALAPDAEVSLLPPMPVVATGVSTQRSLRLPDEKAPEEAPPSAEEAPANDSLMDQINNMGKDLCKRRPDHPKCQQFKEPPPEAAKDAAGAPAPAPVEKQVDTAEAPVAAPPAAAGPVAPAAAPPLVKVESRPPGEKKFDRGDVMWDLVLLCPKLIKDKSTLPAEIRDQYALTQDTMVAQISQGADKVTTWLIAIGEVKVDGPSMTMTVNLGIPLDPDEAYPMMGTAIPSSWQPTGLQELMQADCRLHSKFYWMPTPEKKEGGLVPNMTTGKLTTRSKAAGRYDLVSALQCCNHHPCKPGHTRKLYKVFL